MRSRKRLGEMMRESGLVNPVQLNEALADQWQFGGRLGTILIDKCLIDEKTFLRVLSEQLNVPAITFYGRTIPERVMLLIPKDLAWKYTVVPVETKVVNGRKTLVLGMADPTDAFAVGVMEKVSGHHIEPVLAFDNTIRMLLMEFYDNQYGRGDITLRRQSEPDECELKKIANTTEGRESLDVSSYLGRDPGRDVAPVEAGVAWSDGTENERDHERELSNRAEADDIHDRLDLEFQALLQVLTKKGLINSDEFAGELRALRALAK